MIRSWLTKISFYAIIVGVLISGWGLYQTYLKRNVGSELTALSAKQLDTLEQELVYAEVTGGVPDFNNSYKISLTRKGKRELSSYVFTPRINPSTVS